jgi:hypothetical protein
MKSTQAPRTGAALLAIAAIAGIADAATKPWRAPVAQKLTTKPSAVVAGDKVAITCTLGSTGDTQVDTNSTLGKYLATERKPNWTLPVEIRVAGTSIGKWDLPGLASAASTWKQTASWTAPAAYKGKTVKIECLVDAEKKMLFSSASASLPVLAEAIPKAKLRNGGGTTVAEPPGGPILPPQSQPTSRNFETKPTGGALPDITSRPMLGVGTKTVSWGGTVAVDAAQARSISNGTCKFSLEHFAHNAGAAAAPAFKRRWLNEAGGTLSAVYPSIAPGQYLRQVDTLDLKSGVNHLRLSLDSMDAVAESHEDNNMFEVTVNVAGSCSAVEDKVQLGKDINEIPKP